MARKAGQTTRYLKSPTPFILRGTRLSQRSQGSTECSCQIEQCSHAFDKTRIDGGSSYYVVGLAQVDIHHNSTASILSWPHTSGEKSCDHAAMALPQGFVNLVEACAVPDGTMVSLIGAIVDVMPTAMTRSGEHMLTFKILDRALADHVNGAEGMKIRFFVKDSSNLPKLRGLADIALLRKVKMFTRDGQRLAVNNYHTGVLIFPSSAIPDPHFSIAYLDKQKLECYGVELLRNSLTIGEQQYVMALKQDMEMSLRQRTEEAHGTEERKALREKSTSDEPALKRLKAISSFGYKFRLIEELQPRTWANLCGKVVKTIGTAYGGNDLYVTDYTSNSLLRYYPSPEEEMEMDQGRDGDAFDYTRPSKKPWPGPYEQTVLKVNLKPPHAAYANDNLNEGDWVLLRNVKLRTSDLLKLEGDLWPEDREPNKIQVSKLENLDAPEVEAVLRREEKYWSTRDRKANNTSKEPKLSKKEKKKRNRMAKECHHRKNGGDASIEVAESNLVITKKTQNPHIRCSYEDVTITRVRQILDTDNRRHTTSLPDSRTFVLPFVNVKYRSRVRVVDYEPKILEDFAVPLRSDTDDGIDSMTWHYTTPSYEWSFSLLLEDASTEPDPNSDRIWVQVHHAEAQFLLGNSVRDPENLRHDSQLLTAIREKLFVLWGNLHEKLPCEELNNLPFECCIQEYGIQAGRNGPEDEKKTLHGWQRMYSMFGVTIL